MITLNDIEHNILIIDHLGCAGDGIFLQALKQVLGFPDDDEYTTILVNVRRSGSHYGRLFRKVSLGPTRLAHPDKLHLVDCYDPNLGGQMLSLPDIFTNIIDICNQCTHRKIIIAIDDLTVSLYLQRTEGGIVEKKGQARNWQ
jgi:hypothetical protein